MNREILHAIEHDFDTKTRRNTPSRARLTEEWLKVMQAILEMPVAAWDCPTTASGEIETKERIMYGNNGYGGGYGMNEDYIDRMNRAKKVDSERDPFIGEGQHTLQLLELFEYIHDEKGPTAKARFQVLASNVHPVGSTVCKLWFLVKPGKFKDSITDSDRFADFIMKLKGVEPEKNPGFQVGAAIRELIRAPGTFSQPERGRVILAAGRNVSKKPGEPFIDVSWRPLQQLQAPEQVAQERAKLDASETYALSRQCQKVFRDIQGPGQMQQAPHAATQPQYAPPGAYGNGLPQQGYPQAPQQQWQPQQTAPQGPPPGVPYGQPMQNPVPQGQPQQGAPSGYGAPQQGPGFANQLPPQGGQQGGGPRGW